MCEHVFTANTPNTRSRTHGNAILLHANTANTANTARTQVRTLRTRVRANTRSRTHQSMHFRVHKKHHFCMPLGMLYGGDLKPSWGWIHGWIHGFIGDGSTPTKKHPPQPPCEHSANTGATHREHKSRPQAPTHAAISAVRQLHDLSHLRAGNSSARPGHDFGPVTVPRSEPLEIWKLKHQTWLQCWLRDSYTI